ncbi:MAG: P-loop NTPase fold protein, partial [Bacteroidota bacterium]
KKHVEKKVNLFSFWKANQQALVRWLFLLVVSVLVGVQVQALIHELPLVLPQLEAFIKRIEPWWLVFVVVFLPVYREIQKFLAERQKVIGSILEFMGEIQKLRQTTTEKKLDKNQQEIQEYENLITEVERLIARNRTDAGDVSQAAMADFLSTRYHHTDYANRLGIVSIIRKDFETLSGLFLEPKGEVVTDEEIKEDRKVIQEQFRKPLKRIILYIDDLDRCSDGKVLEVIQAVHLLMAFPLFNVVVGVDKRCIYNALRHKSLAQYPQFKTLQEMEAAGVQVIYPEEYLEKIFQIPFELKKPISKNLGALIGNLLSNSIDEIEEAAPLKSRFRTFEQMGEDIAQFVTDQHNSLTSDEQAVFPERRLSSAKGQAPDSTKERSKTDIAPAVAELKMDVQEIHLLQSMVRLAGDTPRIAKRLVNIYRIIRTHDKAWQKGGIAEGNYEYAAVIFLLAIGIGKYQKYASDIYRMLTRNVEQTLSEALLDDKHPRNTQYRQKAKEIVDYLELVSAPADLSGLSQVMCHHFTKRLPFVKRFTFGIDG